MKPGYTWWCFVGIRRDENQTQLLEPGRAAPRTGTVSPAPSLLDFEHLKRGQSCVGGATGPGDRWESGGRCCLSRCVLKGQNPQTESGGDPFIAEAEQTLGDAQVEGERPEKHHAEKAKAEERQFLLQEETGHQDV